MFMSPLPPPLSPQTQQLVLQNPQLAGLIAEQLRKTCLQLINNSPGQLPVQPVAVMPNGNTPSVAEAPEASTVVTEVKKELSDTLVIPASPPEEQLQDDNTETSSYCDSPPLFSSPVKQPLTSTQVNNTNFEMNLPGSVGAEALSSTEAVKQEQYNTVVSLSSQDIVLPANPTNYNQTDSVMNTGTDESIPEQRHSLRKRNLTHKMATNIRHTKKRQYRVQPV